MCLISPISKKNCPQGRGGITHLYAAPSDAIAGLTFDSDENVTAITVDGTNQQPGFVKVEFEKDTAFFNQEKTRVKNNLNVSQTISFIEPVMTPELRKAMRLLNSCCSLHILVRDNTGRIHYAGISYFADSGEWQTEDMKTGDGSGNTGADSTADSNEYIETFTANTSFYAPFYTGTVAAIPIAA